LLFVNLYNFRLYLLLLLISISVNFYNLSQAHNCIIGAMFMTTVQCSLTTRQS